MKKQLLAFLAFIMFASVSSANAAQSCEDNFKKTSCSCDSEQQSKITPSDSCNKKNTCDICPVEDDEYCVYNQCFFDRQFRAMKKKLCLSKKQEEMTDNLYKTYKSDMECICNKYKNQKNKVLNMIECHNQCWKDERHVLREIRLEMKERSIDFRNDIKEILCKSQYRDFKSFQKSQKKKMKRIIKYGAIYKFPCENCTSYK